MKRRCQRPNLRKKHKSDKTSPLSQIVKKKKNITSLHLQAVAAAPSRTDERRAQILDAVLRILSKDGLDELTFERVGTEAGMARSHVVYYFKDRNELVVSAIRFAALSANQLIESHVGGGNDWKDCLTRYVDANFDWIENNPSHATLYVLLYYLARLKPSYRALHTEIREAGTERVMRLLERSPLGSKKKQLKGMAKAIQAIITGNLVDALTTNESSVADRRKETHERVADWTKEV